MSTDAQKRASTNYNRKQDNIMIRPSKAEGAAIRAAAAAAGKSVQGYVLEAVREKMGRGSALPGEDTGVVRAGSSSLVADDKGTARVVVVSAVGGSPDEESGRSISLEPPQKSAQPKVSIFKELADLPEVERERRMGCDPESMEQHRQEMERKRQRLTELNAKRAKGGSLSRAEDAERRRLLSLCGSSPTQE